MNQVRIALIGAGLRGAAHLATLARLRDAFELVAIGETDPESAARAREAYGSPVYSDLQRMFDEAKPEAVDIVVPPDGHLPLVALAAANGAHALVETPIAPTLDQADAMAKVCESAGVHLEVAENVWRFPNELLKKAAIDAGLLGEVINVQLFYGSGSYHGMCALHTHVGTGPSRVVGHARALKERADAPLKAAAAVTIPQNAWEVGVFDFPNDVTAVYQFPARSERGNYWEIVGTAGSFVGTDLLRYGESAATIPIQAEMAGKTIVALSLAVSPELRWVNPYAKYGVEGPDGHALAHEYFTLHAAASDGTAPAYGIAGGRLDQEMLIGVRESAILGSRPVFFPIRSRTEYENRILREYETRYGADALDTGPDAWRHSYPRGLLRSTYVG